MVRRMWNGFERQATVLISPAWEDEHADLGPRPVIVALHDESRTSGDRAIAPFQATSTQLERQARFSSVVFGLRPEDEDPPLNPSVRPCRRPG